MCRILETFYKTLNFIKSKNNLLNCTTNVIQSYYKPLSWFVQYKNHHPKQNTPTCKRMYSKSVWKVSILLLYNLEWG